MNILQNFKINLSIIAMAFLCLIASSGIASAATFYVKSDGNDANDCTDNTTNACLTIARGIAVASSGDTISVAAGNYTLSASLDPGAKNLIFAGAGIRGSNITKITAPASNPVFSFGTAGNTSTIKDFVLLGNGGSVYVISSSVNCSPTIENNIITKSSYGGINFSNTSAAPTIQNNILVGTTYYGIYLASSNPIVRNNTVVNNTYNYSYEAFNGGTRTNNIAYAGGVGFASCGSNGSVKNNLAFRNITDYGTGCTADTNNTDNLTSSPRFLNQTDKTTISQTAITHATGFSNTSGGIDTAILTDTSADWVDDQWIGYFVTPDMGRSPYPQYFLIIDNSATTLTVASAYNMTNYGASGKPYAITDFTFGTNAPGASTANATVLTTDAYGTSRSGAQDIGAVKAAGTSSSANSTYHVAETGTDYEGTHASYSSVCTTATTPCDTIEYATALAEDGDTIKIAKGTYNLTETLALGYKKSINFKGGYDTADNFASQNVGVRGTYMTRIKAASSSSIISFDVSESVTPNSSLIQNLVLQGNGGSYFLLEGNAYNIAPTIEKNVILNSYGAFRTTHASSAPTVQNNIVIDNTYYGFYLASSSAIIRNNTVTSNTETTTYEAFRGGTRTNNIAYAGGTGFTNCGSSGHVKNSIAFKNLTNYSTGCTSDTNNTDNLTSPPRFLSWMENTTPGNVVAPTAIKGATGFSNSSEGVTATVITDDDADWTDGQWIGYFVTPDIGRSPYPRYFLIVDNSETTLTIVSLSSMTSYGSSGKPYSITDLSFGTNAPGASTANSTVLTTDIYGTARGAAQDIGAVKAAGTSSSSNTTYHVAETGIDYNGTSLTTYANVCTTATTPCASLEYAAAMAEYGDTIKVAGGSYNLSDSINLGYSKTLNFKGGYSTSDNFATQGVGVHGSNMTRLVAASSKAVFKFAYSEASTYNSSLIQNFVMQGNGGTEYLIHATTIDISPTIEKNIFSKASYGAIGITGSSGAPIIQNNIVADFTYYGFRLASSNATAINNTLLSNTSGYEATHKGVRKNNIAYGVGTAYDSCGSNGDTTYSNASTSTVDFNTGCDNGNNSRAAPLFTELTSAASTAMNATTLTQSGAGWTNNQWQGYFVTPNEAATTPRYFLIVSNTTDTLTVASTVNLTSHGSSGHTFHITDFSLQSGSTLRDAGTNTGAPSTDIYGNARPLNTTTDMGATEYVPPPGVTLSRSPATLAENGGTSTVTATLSGTYTDTVTINLSYSGTATNTSDYTRSATSIAITAGNTTGTVTLTGVDDALNEAAETIVVDVDSVTNGVETGTQQVSASITDDDTAPTVTLSRNNATIAENGGTSTVTATLSAASGQDVTVDLSYSGTATNTSDYTRSGTSITITAGGTTGTVTLTGVDDALDEAAETMIVDISAVTNGTESGSQQVSASITDDDDAPTVTLSQGTSPFAENGGTDVVTATLSGASGQDVTVDLSYSGTATNTSDYTRSATSITITAGGTTGTITLTGVDDALDEAAETVIVDISAVTNGTESGSQQITASITDDDAAPTVTLSQGTSPFAENGGTDIVTATLSAVSGQDVTVDLSYSGTATNTSDYTRSATSITITAGGTTGTITLTGVDDVLDEAAETVIVDISAVTNGTESGSQQITASITDDDAAPTVTLSRDNATIVENGGTSTVTATLSATSGQDVTVDLSYSGTTTNITDYTRSATSITITAGSTTGTITLTSVTDTIDENNETVITDISAVTNGTESGTQQVTVTITDDDTAAITVTQSGGTTNITEGSTTDTFTIVLGSQPTSDVTFSLSTDTDTTTDQTVLTFTSGNYNTPQTVTVTAVDDDIAESNHTSTVSFLVASGDSNYSGMSVTSVTANIVDNDSAGVSITQSSGDTIIAEGGATDSYTIVLTSEPTANVLVSVSNDAQSTASATDITFTTANWDTAQTVTITAVDDDLAEANHSSSITHTVSSADNNYDELAASSITASITDDDSAGVTVTASDGSTAVSDGTDDTYTLVLASEPTSNVSISITAGAGISVSPATALFTAANWDTAQTITVSYSDAATESATITHSLSTSDTNYTALNISSLTVTITLPEEDDDAADEEPEIEAPEDIDVAVEVEDGIVVAANTAGEQITESEETYEARGLVKTVTLYGGHTFYALSTNSLQIHIYDNIVYIGDPSANTNQGQVWRIDTSLIEGDVLAWNDDAIGVTSQNGDAANSQFGAHLVFCQEAEQSVAIHSPGDGNIDIYDATLTSRISRISENENEFSDDVFMISDLLDDDQSCDILFGPEYSSSESEGDGNLLQLVNSEGAYMYNGTVSLDTLITNPAGVSLIINNEYGFYSGSSGDVTGDGQIDLVLSSMDGCETYIYDQTDLAQSILNRSEANHVISGADCSSLFGHTTLIGDVSGDGIDDIIIVTLNGGSDNQGLITVVFGSATLADNIILSSSMASEGYAIIQGNYSSGNLGQRISLSDINGDNILDIVALETNGSTNKTIIVSLVQSETSGSSLDGFRLGGSGCRLNNTDDHAQDVLPLLIIFSLWALCLHKQRDLALRRPH